MIRLLALHSLLLLFSLPCWGTLKIAIDPGHGGDETGAVYGKAVESRVALQVSQKLYDRLKKDKNFKALLLRHTDSELSLENRVAKTKNFNADLFISIHANAHPNSKAKGAEFYIQNQLPAEEEALFLAHHEHEAHDHSPEKPKGDVESILYDIEKSQRILKSYQVSTYLRKNWSKQKRRMIRQGPFFVLSQNQSPAVLVELGYLTHPKERAQLLDKKYQAKLARKIHQALSDYAKNIDKLPADGLQDRHGKIR